MEATQAVEEAAAMARARLATAPSFALYASIDAQLRYLSAVLDGSEQDRTRLAQLNFGVYAAREFEASDPEFAEKLFPAFWVATQLAQGLKVTHVPV